LADRSPDSAQVETSVASSNWGRYRRSGGVRAGVALGATVGVAVARPVADRVAVASPPSGVDPVDPQPAKPALTVARNARRSMLPLWE
jgi:hypothetical protein